MRATSFLPDPAAPGNIDDIISPQRGHIEALIELLIEAGADAMAVVLIEVLDQADAPFEDLEPSLGAPKESMAAIDRRHCNVDQTESWRTPTDDLECADDFEPDLGWHNPEGEIPHSYHRPSRTPRADVERMDADGDLSGGCFGEARHG